MRSSLPSPGAIMRASSIVIDRDNHPDSVVAVDLEGRITSWNRAAEQLYGYSADEAFGQLAVALLWPKDDQAIRDSLRLIIVELGRPVRDVAERRTKDGRAIFVSSLRLPLRDERGTIVGTVAMSHDVTEQHSADRRARQLAEVAEAASQSVILSDLHRNITFWNSGAKKLFGYTAEEAKAQRPGFLVPKDRTEEWEPLAASIREGTLLPSYRTVRLRKDGSEVNVLLTVFAIRDENGDVNSFAVLATDLTADIAEEEQQRLLEARVQLAQKAESLQLLAGGVAHDFNNLLQAILGNAALVRSGSTDGEVDLAAVEEIENAAQRAAALTRKLRAYTGTGAVSKEQLDLSAFVKEMADLLRAALGGTVSIEMDLAAENLVVNADAAQLTQVIMNLIMNASEAIGDEPGTITITTGRVDSEVHTVFLEVADDGCGMDEATLPRIFDPFFSTKFAGRGLGLAAVQGIAKAHGGTISVESQIGVGTTFRLLLSSCQAA